jgi:hypothetical protein
MQRAGWLLLAVIALLTLMTTAVLAQGRGPGKGVPNYDPKTEVTVKGTIEDVQQHPGKGNWTGTHLILKTDSETFEVHVGPSAFVNQHQFSFAKGDTVEVTGSKVTIGGKEALLAREIIKDGKTLVLRNAQGVPEWSGGRRRSN